MRVAERATPIAAVRFHRLLIVSLGLLLTLVELLLAFGFVR